ncbi:MAG: YfhO family protein [Anaerolineales bacterium]|nr:YfhO family protein [Anaerolineales bacterium]
MSATTLYSLLRQHHRSLVVLLVLVALATALLHKALLPGNTLLPLDLIQTIAPWDSLDLGPLQNPLLSDPFYSFYPRRQLLTMAIRQGQIPLWNPYIMTGTPIIANPNFQPFYVPNWIGALLWPAHRALVWLAWLHLMTTGGLMVLFLRRHRLHWLAALLGGGIWLLNGYLVVWLENPHRLSTLTWLPGVLWAFETAVQKKRVSYAAIGGLFLGLSILGGQMQFVFAFGILLGVYALVRLSQLGRQQRVLPVKPMVYLALIGLLGLGIGALTLLPAAEFAAFSQRTRFTFDNIQQTRWPWQHLVTLIAPDFYGNPVNTSGYWDVSNYAEMTAYFGVVALLLALMAPWVARRRQFLWAALVSTAVAFSIVLGTPLVKLLFLFPGAQFISLTRTLFLLPLCGAWLAALSLDGLLHQPVRPRLALLVGLGAITAVTLLTISSVETRPATWVDMARSGFLLVLASGILLLLGKKPQLSASLLVLLIFVDLWQWGWDFNPVTSTEYLYPKNEVTEFLAQDQELFRVLPLQSEKVVFGPNVLSLFGLPTLGGYTPLIQENYYQFYKSVSDKVHIDWMQSNKNMLVMSELNPQVHMLNVKYVLSAVPLAAEIIPQREMGSCATAVPLSNEPLTQTFAADPGLNRLDLLLAPRSDTVPTEATLQLWRGNVGAELIAEVLLPVGTFAEPTPHPVFFAPVTGALEQTYVWQISGDETTAVCLTPENSLAFATYGTSLIDHGQKEDVWVYEIPNVAPRAIMLPQTENASLMAESYNSAAQVNIIDYNLNNVVLDVETAESGLLVLTDANYPGWTATVDNVPQAIQTVDGIFRGVLLPKGSHTVSFEFRPITLYWGMGFAGFTLFIIILLLFIKPKSR